MKALPPINSMGFKARRVGLEFENPILDSRHEPISFRLMQNVWQDFAGFGWSIVRDKICRSIVGAEKDFGGGLVMLSSDVGAGNLEMALPPTDSIEASEILLGKVRSEVLEVFRKRRLSLLAFGIQPAPLRYIDRLCVDNDRHKARLALGVSDFFNHSLLSAISAHQVGVSLRLEEVLDVTNELLKVTGLIVALCGNSSVHGWRLLPWKDWRVLVWDFRFLETPVSAEKLGGMPKAPFSFLEDFFSYYWELPRPILPACRQGFWNIPDEKLGILDYLSKTKVPAKNLLGEATMLTPSPADINVATNRMWSFAKPHVVVDPNKVTVKEFLKHLSDHSLLAYLEGRLANCYIECRAASAAPVGEETALPALILGLVENMAELKNFTKSYSWEEWRELLYYAAAVGLEARIGGSGIYGLLERLVAIAEAGLRKRKIDETCYLEPLKKRIATKQNPADRAIAEFHKGKEEFLRYVTYNN